MYTALLHVVTLLTLVASTLGDPVATSPRVCTIKPDEGEHMYGKIGEMSVDCLGTDMDQLKLLESLQEHKTFFKNICDNRQQIHECLAELELTSEVCQNATPHQNFKVLRNLLETTLDSGCVGDGEVLASMVTVYKGSPSSPFDSDPLRECISTVLASEMRIIDSELTMASGFYVIYRAVHSVKDCFGQVEEGHVDLANNVESILTEIVNKLKCVHPQDGTIVLCKTIDVTLPDVPRLCPIKLRDDATSTMYDILNHQVDSCFLFFVQPDTVRRFNEIDNIDIAHDFFKHHCRKRDIINQCLSDVMASSSVCLDEIHQNLMKVTLDFLQNPLNYACEDNGRSLGNVIFKVMSEKNKTQDSKGAIGECLRLAGRLDEGVKSSDAGKIFLNYRRLKVFKECFIDKIRGDNTAVLRSLDILNFVQRNMNCIAEQTGDIVLCETIDITPETGNEVCPLVDEDENKPLNYDLFVDQGFICLKATTLDFSLVDDFTTIKEHRTFFSTFCHKRLAIKHCAEDLSSLSKICQSETDHQMVTILTDFIGNIIETGCKLDGEVLAAMLHSYMTGEENARDQISTCFQSVGIQAKNKKLITTDMSEHSMDIFRAFESLKGCVTSDNAGFETFKTLFLSFINDIIRGLKCIHPDDGATVPCETIVNN